MELAIINMYLESGLTPQQFYDLIKYNLFISLYKYRTYMNRSDIYIN